MAWSDISKELNVSRSMCHAVMRNDKRLGRDSLERLNVLEAKLETDGSHPAQQTVDISKEPRADENPLALLRAENASLKAELAKALDTISNLSKALAGMNNSPASLGSEARRQGSQRTKRE